MPPPNSATRVHVELDGLEPGREYWYRFIAGGEASQVGRLKTAPAAGAPVDRINFALCGCQHYETGYFTAYKHLAAERPDFVFHSGDYIYEYRAGVPPGPGGCASTTATRSTRLTITGTVMPSTSRTRT